MSAETQWRHGCVLVGCWPAMETCVCAYWLLTSNGGMGACWSATDTWVSACSLLISKLRHVHVCAGLVLISNGDMDVCLLVADQQWTHGLVLGWC